MKKKILPFILVAATVLLQFSFPVFAKDQPQITVQPTQDGTVSYGTKLKDVDLTGGAAKFGDIEVEGSFQWKNQQQVPTVQNSGYVVVFIPDNTTTYDIAEATVVVTVTPKPLTISGISIEDKQYDGNKTAQIKGTEKLNGAVQGDDVTLDSSKKAASFSDEEVGTGKAVTVSGYALAGAARGNYELSQPTGLKADILPLEADILISDFAMEYTGKPQSPKIESVQRYETLYESVDDTEYSDSEPPVDAGTYQLSVTVTEANYEAETISKTFSITKADPPYTIPTVSAVVYSPNLTLADLSIPDSNNEGTFQWKNPSIVPTVSVSDYIAVYTPNDTQNYNIIDVVIPVTVNKADAAIKMEDISGTYSGDPFAIYAKDVPVGMNVIYTIKNSSGETVSEAIEIGTYTITATATGANYNDATATATLTIKAASKGGAGGVYTKFTARPTASVDAGAVEAGTKVELSSATYGAVIYYTTDGSTPTKKSSVYQKPITIKQATTIKAFAAASGMASSSTIYLRYTVDDEEEETQTTVPVSFVKNASKVKYIKAYSDNTFRPDQAITRYEMIGALSKLLDIESTGKTTKLSDVSSEYKALVSQFTEAGIINGFEDGTFRGEDGLTRAEFTKIMSILLNQKSVSGNSSFPDARGHWAEGYIKAFSSLGYLKGDPDGNFYPDDEMTRAEFVTIINRITGVTATSVPPVFDDLKAHWAYNDIMSVYTR